jgi:hypothetical protein
VNFKDWVESIHTIIETAAIIVGGVWAWLAFFRRRLSFPRVGVEHRVTHRGFGAASTLVHVTVIVQNRGEVLVDPRWMIVRLQQVLPEPASILQAVDAGDDPLSVGEHEVVWPLLGERVCEWAKGEHEIEPGETERIECDFFIPDYVRTIEVYSHIENPSKRDRKVGWPETTFYDLAATSARSGDEQAESGLKDDNSSASREAPAAAGAEASVNSRTQEEVAAEGR